MCTLCTHHCTVYKGQAGMKEVDFWAKTIATKAFGHQHHLFINVLPYYKKKTGPAWWIL